MSSRCCHFRPNAIRCGSRSPLVLLAVVFGLGSLLPTAILAGPADDDYRLAAELYKSQSWALAEEAFKTFTKKYPEDERASVAKLYQGITHSKQGEHTEAHALFKEYIANNPQGQYVGDATYRLARSSYLANKPGDAETEYARFLKQFPKHQYRKFVIFDYADVLAKRDKQTEAVQWYSTFLQEFPTDGLATQAQYNLAKSYETLKKTSEAIREYSAVALTTSEEAPKALLNVGRLQFLSKDYTKAATTFADFATKFPKSPLAPKAAFNLGSTHYQLGDFGQAAVAFDSVTEDPEFQVRARYWKGRSLKRLREFAKAITAFQLAYTDDPKGELAEESLFQEADSYFALEDYARSLEFFSRTRKEFPQGDFAERSLFQGTEAAFRLGDLVAAETLLDTFESDYAKDSSLKYEMQVMRGRWHLKRGKEGDSAAAATLLEDVVDNATSEQTKNEARFEAARAYQTLDNHQRALEVLKPLVEQVIREGAQTTFPEALPIQAESYLALDNFTGAKAAAGRYLSWRPQGDAADMALTALALAEMNLGNKAEGEAAYARLVNEFPNSKVVPEATYTLAEAAYDGSEYKLARDLFSKGIQGGVDAPFHAESLSGLAWTQYKLENYAEAARLFSQVYQDHPKNVRLAPEAVFMIGSAYRDDGDLQRAATAYSTAFAVLKPEEPVLKTGAEDAGTNFYAFRAGREAARTYAELGLIDQADKAYDVLLETFPQPQTLDRILDNWALANMKAERYAKAGQVYQRLLDEVPTSVLADDALLALAENALDDNDLRVAKDHLQKLAAAPRSDDPNTPADVFRVDPDVREVALFHLIQIRLEERSWALVADLAEQFLTGFPKSRFALEARYHLGEAHLNEKKNDEAIETLQQVKQVITEAPPAESTPQNKWRGRVFVLLAEAHFRKKQYPDVEAVAADLKGFDADSPWMYQVNEVRGRALKNQAKFPEARVVFEQVIASPEGRRTETAAKAQFMIAETLLIEKQYQQAILAYLKVNALYQFPEWQSASLFQAAQAHATLEDWAAAARTYEKLIESFPESRYAKDAAPLLEAARQKAS